MFYGGYDYQMGKERALDMRTEVTRNRLLARLAKSRSMSNETGLEETSPRRSMAARSAAVLVGLFRY
jgi:hypothetical protein